jgi:hypothetical protein
MFFESDDFDDDCLEIENDDRDFVAEAWVRADAFATIDVLCVWF